MLDEGKNEGYFDGDESVVLKKEISLKKERLLYPLVSVAFWLSVSLIMAGVRFLSEELCTAGIISHDTLNSLRILPLIIGVITYGVWAKYCLESKRVGEKILAIKQQNKVKTLFKGLFGLNDIKFWACWVVSTLALNYVLDWGAVGNFIWLGVMLLACNLSNIKKEI